MTNRVVVRVPATTANLGPGFDVMGMALSLYNRFEVQLLESGYEVETAGGEADLMPRGADNLVVQAAEATWKAAGMDATGWKVRLWPEIPLGGGLGSSATAIVAGVIAANELAGRVLSRQAMLRLATELEGHPDNVAPALLGGLTIVVNTEDGDVCWERVDVQGVDVVVAVPDEPLSTGRSRMALPDTVSHEDAVYNVGRAALLATALGTRNYEAVAVALDDRLHQPYRAQLVPGFADVVTAAAREGALGAFLSGAGPSIAAFVRRGMDAQPVGIAMTAAFREVGIGAHWLVLQPDTDGAVIEARGEP